jgi:hypothetical protein
MSEKTIDFGPSLRSLSREDWFAEVQELVGYDGSFARLGDRHAAASTRHGNTLLVSFETFQGIQALSPKSQPIGWEMVRTRNWSSLALICDGDTWFRDQSVYGYFDRLIDDGFFDEFDTVLFFGAGPCGYAAAAFSVAAPGARVLAIQPQATLAAHLTEWDRRFAEARRWDFTSRFGYAPDMLEAADRAYILYDPMQTEDAMHATLFANPNVTRLRMPLMGASLQTELLQMGILVPVIDAASHGRLTAARFGALARARRNHPAYLRRLLARAEDRGEDDLIRMLCRNVTRRMTAPRFQRRLEQLTTEPA